MRDTVAEYSSTLPKTRVGGVPSRSRGGRVRIIGGAMNHSFGVDLVGQTWEKDLR
jgi:hypothetical protein